MKICPQSHQNGTCSHPVEDLRARSHPAMLLLAHLSLFFPAAASLLIDSLFFRTSIFSDVIIFENWKPVGQTCSSPHFTSFLRTCVWVLLLHQFTEFPLSESVSHSRLGPEWFSSLIGSWNPSWQPINSLLMSGKTYSLIKVLIVKPFYFGPPNLKKLS